MLKGFVCPSGEKVSIQECLTKNCNPGCGIPKVIRMGIALKTEDRGYMISATSILGCLRKTFWERTTDYWESLPKLYFAFRGTLGHMVLQNFMNQEVNERNPLRRVIEEVRERWLTEYRFYKNIEGIEVSGQIDAFEFTNGSLKEGVLHEWKTTSEYQIPHLLKNGPREEHILQAQIYANLAKPALETQSIQIHYLTMSSGILSTGETFHLKKRKNGQLIEETVKIPKVAMMKEADLLNLIVPKIKLLQHAFQTGSVESLPPADEKTEFLCRGFCPFVDNCDHGREVNARVKK